MYTENATAAILCGGKSRRMGFDKALLQHRDMWLLSRNAGELAELFARVALISNEREKLAEIPGLERFSVVTDRWPDCGPLGGIATALSACGSPLLFVMACDMPNLDLDAVRRLYGQAEGHQVTLFLHGDRVEPLFAFYHQSCLPVFEEMLARGQLKIRDAFPDLRVNTVALTREEGARIFINLNTPAELAQWKAEESKREGGGL